MINKLWHSKKADYPLSAGVYDSPAGTLVSTYKFASKGMFSCSYLRIADIFNKLRASIVFLIHFKTASITFALKTEDI